MDKDAMRLRVQWGDDVDDGLTTLAFHEYEKSRELRPIYREMFQDVDIDAVNILLQREERVSR